jgi:hypothetical protein
MKFAALGAICFFACATPLLAQGGAAQPAPPIRPHAIVPPATRPPAVAVAPDPDAPPPATAEDVRRLHAFAGCVAARRASRSREVLAMDFRTREYSTALIDLAVGERSCADFPRGQMSRSFFAGRLAEALLESSLRGTSLAARIAPNPARPALEARDESELMSLCTVLAAPAAVEALLASDPASEAELASVRGLTPQVAQCLTAGVTGRFNRSAIRSLLALAAYRLSEHAGSSAAPAG